MSVPPVTLTFLQTSLHHWQGQLSRVSQCVDNRTGLPAEAPRFNITEDPVTGRCHVVVRGATPQGRRYVSYPNLDAAQRGGLRWARRRFRRAEDV